MVVPRACYQRIPKLFNAEWIYCVFSESRILISD